MNARNTHHLWASCRLFEAVQIAFPEDVQAQESPWGTDQVIRFNEVLRVGPWDEIGAPIRRDARELVFTFSMSGPIEKVAICTPVREPSPEPDPATS